MFRCKSISKKNTACLLFSLVLLLLLPSGQAEAAPVSVDRISESARLANSAFYLIDSRGEHGIAQISAPTLQNRFKPLAGDIPAQSQGVLWLRFSMVNSRLDSTDENSAGQEGIFMRLGPGIPAARAYIAREIAPNGTVLIWNEFRPNSNGNFRLPNPRNLPMTVYVRVNDMPGLWFNPLLLTQDSSGFGAGGVFSAMLAVILGAAMVFTLARGLNNREEWRLWGGAVTACAMIQAIFCGRLAEQPSIHLTALPMLLAPGLALMLIPHLGRHLLQSRTDLSLDRSLIGLSLVGALCALGPLLPSLGWTVKLLPLVPLLLFLIFFPVTVGLMQKRPGSFIFLGACALPFMGSLLATTAIGSHSGPGPNFTLLGYTASALVFALARPTGRLARGDDFPLDTMLKDSDNFTKSIAFKNQTMVPLSIDIPHSKTAAAGETDATAAKRADPIALAQPADGQQPFFTYEERLARQPSDDVLSSPRGADYIRKTSGTDSDAMALEYDELEMPDSPISWDRPDLFEKKRAELLADTLEAAGLDVWDQMTSGHYANIVKNLDELKKHRTEAEFISGNLSEALHGLGEAMDNLDRMAQGDESKPGVQSVFNLARIIRKAHEETMPLAEMRGLTISWYISPALPAFFVGDEDALTSALRYLMQGAVESADSGSVQFLARSSGDNLERDIVQFTLIDSTMNMNTLRRPARLLARAWELAKASYGSFSIDFTPERGTEINFSLKLKPYRQDSGSGTPAEPILHTQESAAGTASIVQANADAAAEPEEEPILLDTPIVIPAQRPPVSDTACGQFIPRPERTEFILYEPEEPAMREDETALEDDVTEYTVQERTVIAICDPSASGRRLLMRRLEGLPEQYSLLEAQSFTDMRKALLNQKIALAILDEAMSAEELEATLKLLVKPRGQPPVPALCLVSHASQAERMRKIGCVFCYDKTKSKEKLQREVLSMAEFSGRTKPGPAAGGNTAAASDTERQASMFEQIVSSLDSEIVEDKPAAIPEKSASVRAVQPNAEGMSAAIAARAAEKHAPDNLIQVPGLPGEFLSRDLLPKLPVFTRILKQSLDGMRNAVIAKDAPNIGSLATRIAAQSNIYGLPLLERMAACVEKAAAFGDEEAFTDLAEELISTGTRYRNALSEAHDEYLENTLKTSDR